MDIRVCICYMIGVMVLGLHTNDPLFFREYVTLISKYLGLRAHDLLMICYGTGFMY